MIKIVTAVGNPTLNEELKKYNEFNVIGNDVIYAEGILELLEIDREIDCLIIGENINNNEDIKQFTEKIISIKRSIKIILIINKKNKELESKLFKLGYIELFYEDEPLDNIINYLKTKNIEYLNEELRLEIENLKRFIIEKNNKKNKIKDNKIIGVAGARGIGKTSFCIEIGKVLCKNNKILIIDFDLVNHMLEDIYNKKVEYSKINESNIHNFIFNLERNIDILTGLNILYSYNKINFFDFKKIILELKKEYNYIFVDTYCENNFENNKYIFNYFDYIFLLSGINKFELIKTKKIINNITQKMKIKKEKIKLILYRLDICEVLKSIFRNKENLFQIDTVGIIKNTIIKNNKIINNFKYKKIIKKI